MLVSNILLILQAILYYWMVLTVYYPTYQIGWSVTQLKDKLFPVATTTEWIAPPAETTTAQWTSINPITFTTATPTGWTSPITSTMPPATAMTPLSTAASTSTPDTTLTSTTTFNPTTTPTTAPISFETTAVTRTTPTTPVTSSPPPTVNLVGTCTAVGANCGEFSDPTCPSGGMFASMNFPNSYPTNVTCDYRIVAPQGKQVLVHFAFFNISPNKDSQGNDLDYSAWYDGPELQAYAVGNTPPPDFNTTQGHYEFIAVVRDIPQIGYGWLASYFFI